MASSPLHMQSVSLPFSSGLTSFAPQEQPMQLRQAHARDGHLLSQVNQKTPPLSLHLSGNHIETIFF